MLLVWREICGGAAGGTCGVAARGGPAEIEIIAVGENAVVALDGGFGEGFLTAPGLNDDVFGHTGYEDFIPADYGFAVLGDNFLYSLAEISLEGFVVFQGVRLLELLDFCAGVPLFAVHFVAADMKIMVGEELGHFGDEVVKELVGFLVGGVHGGIENAPLALDFVGAGAAG